MTTKRKTPAWVKARADMAEATSNGLDPFDAVEVPVHMAARKPAKAKDAKTVKAAASGPPEPKPAAVAGDTPDTSEAVPGTPTAEVKEGRPTKYRPEFAAIAKALCSRGATDADLAEEFDVATTTIWRWSCKHPDFCSALKVEKGTYDDRVERSLAQRAVGYSYTSEKIFHHQGTITRAKCIEHVPPDPGAAKLWLTNRRAAEWREKTETTVKADGFITFWRAMGEPGALDALLKAGPPQA